MGIRAWRFVFRVLHVTPELKNTFPGTGRITAIDEEGRTYISDIKGPQNGSDPDIY